MLLRSAVGVQTVRFEPRGPWKMVSANGECRMKTVLTVVIAMASIAAVAALPPHLEKAITNAAAVTEAKTYTNAAGASLNYRFHAPAKVEPGKRYPLVLFLHGVGSRGSDNTRQLGNGVWPIFSYMKAKGMEGYIIAPQCPDGEKWGPLVANRLASKPSAAMALVMELLEKTIKDFPVDARRVYVTGLSMGGFGTWDIVQRRPDLFAAAMPICGGGDTTLAWKVRSVPIWVFHGDSDTIVPPTYSRQMVSALWQCDGNVRYREYPGVGHNCWEATYADPTVLDWLFSQMKK